MLQIYSRKLGIPAVSRKIQTTWKYASLGGSLGATWRSKWLLATMLPRLKLHRVFKRRNSYRYAALLRIGEFVWCVRFREEDIFIFHDVFGNDGYVGHLLYDDPPICILDLGAHIGLASLLFAARFPEAVIHSYEPDPENFGLLEENTAHIRNIAIHNVAVGPEATSAILYGTAGRHSASSLKRRGNDNGDYEVKCVVQPLDTIISSIGRTVDLIKFDIEGIEYETFAQSSLVHQVKYLVGEMKTSAEEVDNFIKMFSKHEAQVRCLSKKMYLIHLHRRSGKVYRAE